MDFLFFYIVLFCIICFLPVPLPVWYWLITLQMMTEFEFFVLFFNKTVFNTLCFRLICTISTFCTFVSAVSDEHDASVLKSKSKKKRKKEILVLRNFVPQPLFSFPLSHSLFGIQTNIYIKMNRQQVYCGVHPLVSELM